MEHRRIGQLEVSVVGVGCNNFGRRIDDDQAVRVVQAALETGITHFDTADLYGAGQSEQILGRALGRHRADVVVATKFGMGPSVEEGYAGGSAEWVARAADRSLRNLGTDWIDLYLLHQPDPTTDIDETLGALRELVTAGKVREIGCSNFTAEMIDEAAEVASGADRTPFCTCQNQYSVLHRAPETEGVLEACQRRDLTFVPFFPLEAGLLTGKYVQGEEPPAGTRMAQMPPGFRARFLTDDGFAKAGRLQTLAESRGHSLLDLAISWLLAQQPVASVIAGASSPEQVVTNAEAGGWRLGADDLAEIDDIVLG